MDRLHARYPFLAAAREAVEAAAVDLAELVEADDAAVERAVARVEACLAEGTAGEPSRDARTELLSYPVARVLVSAVDQPALVRRYAAAEARTARERFVATFDDDAELASARGERLTLERLLAEFDLTGSVTEREAGYAVAVGPYLALSRELSGPDWRLVARPLADGWVPVSTAELYDLLEAAVRERVAEGLPFAVPGAVAEGLAEEIAHLEELLAEREPPSRFDAVVPERFPPCMVALAGRVADGEDLPAHSRFALVTFLSTVGLSPEEVAGVFADADPETARYQAAHVGGDAVGAYPPPSCATMQALGDCVNMDERCETIDHPLAYYGDALADAGAPPGGNGAAAGPDAGAAADGTGGDAGVAGDGAAGDARAGGDGAAGDDAGRDGVTEDGAAGDAVAGDDASRDGATEDGATEDGAAGDGAAQTDDGEAAPYDDWDGDPATLLERLA